MTSLLLDTHALLWFLWDDSQLSSIAKQVIEDPQSRKLVSIASCWEIAIKVGLGNLIWASQVIVFCHARLLKIIWSCCRSPLNMPPGLRKCLCCIVIPLTGYLLRRQSVVDYAW